MVIFGPGREGEDGGVMNGQGGGLPFWVVTCPSSSHRPPVLWMFWGGVMLVAAVCCFMFGFAGFLPFAR